MAHGLSLNLVVLKGRLGFSVKSPSHPFGQILTGLLEPRQERSLEMGLWWSDEINISPDGYQALPDLTPGERRYRELTSVDIDGHLKKCSRKQELVEELESSFGTPGKKRKCPECSQTIATLRS